jgi:hypothetical protein
VPPSSPPPGYSPPGSSIVATAANALQTAANSYNAAATKWNNYVAGQLNINTSAPGGGATSVILGSVLGVPTFGSGGGAGTNFNQNPGGGGAPGGSGGAGAPPPVNPPAAGGVGDGVSPAIFPEGAATIQQEEAGAAVIKSIFTWFKP